MPLLIHLHSHICRAIISASYQSTMPGVDSGSEMAPYIICSVSWAVKFAKSMGATQIFGFDYWGNPSVTAKTFIKECAFVAGVLRKLLNDNTNTEFAVHLPPSLVERVRSIQAKH